MVWFGLECFEACANSKLIKSRCVTNREEFVRECEKNEPNLNITTLKYECEETVDIIEFQIDTLRQRFINLKEIDVSSLGIEKLQCKGDENELRTPEKVDIVNFNASNNHLTKISGQFLWHLPKIRVIDLSSNNISTVAKDDFNENPALEKLNLANNQINRLDSRSFSMLYQLEILDLSHNTIEMLEEENLLKNNVKMNVLNLAGNPMEHFRFSMLPSEARILVFLPKETKTLDLTCRPLLVHQIDATSINSTVVDLPCHLTHALANPEQLNSLEMLNASGNDWEGTRKIVENLHATLKVLDLSKSNIKRLNMSILARFHHLQHLNLSHANIFDITIESFDSQFQHLCSLDLSYNDLRVVNFEIPSANIDTLNLEGNKLIKISEKICPSTFRNLNRLAINKNRFNCIDLKEFLAPWLAMDSFSLINNSTDDVNVHGVDCDPTARRTPKSESNNRTNGSLMPTVTFYIIIAVSICFIIIIAVIIVCCRNNLRTPKPVNTVERPASYTSLTSQRITNRRSNGMSNFNETTPCNNNENDYAELSLNRPYESYAGCSGYSVPSDSLSMHQRPQSSHMYSLPYGYQLYSTVNKHKSNPQP